MESVGPFRPSAGIVKGTASQNAVVVLRGIDPSTTLAELQDVYNNNEALYWDVHLDPKLLEMTLEIKFEDKERADSYIACLNHVTINEQVGPRPHLEQDLRWSSGLTSSTTDGIMTPRSTTAADSMSETASTVDIGLLSDTIPWPGRAYRIQHRTSGRLITLVEGCLQLQLPETTKGAGGWHWVCVEQDGWLGFRNPVSGTYMGHDKRGRIWAQNSHHRSHESFCVRRHPDGGYVILVKHGDELWQMAFDEASGALVEKRKSDDQWLFDAV